VEPDVSWHGLAWGAGAAERNLNARSSSSKPDRVVVEAFRRLAWGAPFKKQSRDLTRCRATVRA